MADDPGPLPTAGGSEPPVKVKKERAIASKTIAAAAVAFLLIAFGVANDDRVNVDYLVVSRDTPLIVVIAVSAFLGMVIGALIVYRRKR